MESIREQKKNLRSEIRQRKKQFTLEQLFEKSMFICQKLLADEQIKKAKHIMFYYPLADEVNVVFAMKTLQEEKIIILPTVVDNDIVPVELTKETNLTEGAFHILEPQNNAYKGDIDLILVPGMAFDSQGNRLGRGKGFYDRFLQKYPQVPTIGICFDFQKIEKVPCEPFDKPMKRIIY